MTTDETEGTEVGDDLEITKVERRTSAGGAWVRGRLNGHRFDALVFPEHAENRDWEIGGSQVSKLSLQRISDGKTVFNWDRGIDHPAEGERVEEIVSFLCEGIAEFVFGGGEAHWSRTRGAAMESGSLSPGLRTPPGCCPGCLLSFEGEPCVLHRTAVEMLGALRALVEAHDEQPSVLTDAEWTRARSLLAQIGPLGLGNAR